MAEPQMVDRHDPGLGGALPPEVSHPLDQLRWTIRRYVVIEGLLSAAIFVGLWFVGNLVQR